MVIRRIHVDINAENFVSDEQEEDFNKKADEIIKDMKKRLNNLTYLYD